MIQNDFAYYFVSFNIKRELSQSKGQINQNHYHFKVIQTIFIYKNF